MLIPTLLYCFFLFLKLAVRLGLTWELVAAWPMWIGVALGTQLVKLDRILAEYLRLYHQKDIKEINMRSLILNFNIVLGRLKEQSKKQLETAELATQTAELATQNAVFAAGWTVVALFGMTSAIGFLGKGVVLGVGLQLFVRVAKSLVAIPGIPRLTPEKLVWFFAPIKRRLPKNEMAIAGVIFLTFFGVISFF